MAGRAIRYLDTQAELGITKHIGGNAATNELIRLCHISKKDRVLDVGCGIGTTPVRLAKEIGCRVVTVDVSPKMIGWAEKWAKENNVEGKIEFLVADARKLPFKDGAFDVVLCESVLAFVKDKKKALSEFRRVLKKGGYLGLNEGIWWPTEPPADVKRYYEKVAAGYVLPEAEFRRLLVSSGFKLVSAKPFRVGVVREFQDRLELIGPKRIGRVVTSVAKLTWKMIIDPGYRKMFVNAAKVPRGIANLTGFGLYVVRK